MSNRRPIAVASLAIVTITLTMSGVAPFVAQTSNGATLSERMTSLQNMFKSKDSGKQQSSAKSSSQNSSNSRKPIYRLGRPSFRHTNHAKRSPNNPIYQAQGSNRSQPSNQQQANPQKKSPSGLSKFLSEKLFKSKQNDSQATQSTAQQANQQRQRQSNLKQRQRQQQLANKGKKAEPRSQASPGIPIGPEVFAGEEIIIESEDSDESESSPVIAKVRKSPSTARQDDLNEALSDLQESEEIMPGSVVIDSAESAEETPATITDAEPAVIAMDDYGYSEPEPQSTTESETSEELAELESNTPQASSGEVAPAEVVEPETEYAADAPLENESMEIIGQVPLEEEMLVEQPVAAEPRIVEESHELKEELTSPPAEQVFAEQEATPTEPTEDLTATTELSEQQVFDIHDALLSEDIYAEESPTESVEEAAIASSPQESAETPEVAAEPAPSDQFASQETMVRQEIVAVDPTDVKVEPEAVAAEEILPTETQPTFSVKKIEPRETLQNSEDNLVASEAVESDVEESFVAKEVVEQEPTHEAVVEEQTPISETIVAEPRPQATLPPVASGAPIEVNPEAFVDNSPPESDSHIERWNPKTESVTVTDQARKQDSAVFTDTNAEPPGAEFFDEVIKEPIATKSAEPAQPEQKVARKAENPAKSRKQMEATRLIRPRGDVLTTVEQPVIVSHVEGPRSIVVGKEASYRVVLENTSQTTAHNLSASVQVPSWAELVEVVCSDGLVEQLRADDNSDTLQWHLPELAAHSSHTMQLQLIPRTGRAFQLGVQWKQQPTKTKTIVQVQEPKLALKLNGPDEVLFGEPRRYQLVLENPGNAPAENVAISLIPPGSDSDSASTHILGTLGPQEVKEMELELTAREAGEMVLHAFATARNDLRVDTIKRVKCQKPELVVDWRGPEQKYAGTETAYYFRVRNPGNADASNVEVTVNLPRAIKFLSASDSFSYDSKTGRVKWKLDRLKPKEEQFMQVRCELDLPGLQQFDVEASAANGLVADAKSVRTEVVALADLKLNVRDPRGAQPTGEPVTYEIRVENRGSTDAQGIAIVGLFSEGIDPVSVEGAESSVKDGRVSFQNIKSLPPGGEVVLKIRAVASQTGMHIFRAEVDCHDLDIRLAAEETTRFFEDEFRWNEGETPYTATRSDSTTRR